MYFRKLSQALVAQGIEHRFPKPGVASSNLAVGTNSVRSLINVRSAMQDYNFLKSGQTTTHFRLGRLLAALPFLLTFVALGCDSASSSDPDETVFEPIRLHEEWQTAEPAEVGIDPVMLATATQAAAEIRRLKSLVVIKDGKLVYESYYKGAQKDELFDVRSVTKSVVSALAGIALAEGSIQSLDMPIGLVFSRFFEVFPAGVENVTVRHLLTMSGGWQYDEWGGTSYSDWIRSGEPEVWALSQPMINTPGTTFTYNSSAVHLLGVLIEEQVGQSLEEYAASKLFGKLGISQALWEQLPNGYPNGGAGLALRARDLAKIGQLYLQLGKSGTIQVLPESWVTASTSIQTPSSLPYGFLWWLDNSNSSPVFYANGYGGQIIYVVPEQNLVVVTTTNFSQVNFDNEGESALFASVWNLITRKIVPSVR